MMGHGMALKIRYYRVRELAFGITFVKARFQKKKHGMHIRII